MITASAGLGWPDEPGRPQPGYSPSAARAVPLGWPAERSGHGDRPAAAPAPGFVPDGAGWPGEAGPAAGSEPSADKPDVPPAAPAADADAREGRGPQRMRAALAGVSRETVLGSGSAPAAAPAPGPEAPAGPVVGPEPSPGQGRPGDAGPEAPAGQRQPAAAMRGGGVGWPGEPGRGSGLPDSSGRDLSGQSAIRRDGTGPGTDTEVGPDGTGLAESEDDVVIPAMPDAAADTPIARAAQAAVVARSGGQSWPKPGSCRIITIANQKGGVGKTTTSVNLAASLAMHGARVLVIDLDPQGNASTALDIDHHSGVPSVYDVVVDGQELAGVVQVVRGYPQLYCVPATIDLAGAEIELVPLVARESRLARAVTAYDESSLDYILIDCPPSLGLLTVNALVAAAEVLIPIQCEYYALEGLEQLLRTVELVRSHLNPRLAVSTILLTMYDARTRLAAQVADEVRDHFGEIVLSSVIPRSVRVSEAPSYGQSVMTYDPGSTGALAYLEAAREIAYRNARTQAG